MKEVTENTLGVNKRSGSIKWFDENCRLALESRKMTRLKVLEENTDENKVKYEEAKWVCRGKKNKLLEQKLYDLEEAYKYTEIMNFY